MRTILFWMMMIIQACACVQAQERYWGQPVSEHHRSTPEAVNDLVHIKLDVRFDYARCYLYGKASITLHPHFYQTDSLRLGRLYRASENYTVYIEYTARPNELKGRRICRGGEDASSGMGVSPGGHADIARAGEAGSGELRCGACVGGEGKGY